MMLVKGLSISFAARRKDPAPAYEGPRILVVAAARGAVTASVATLLQQHNHLIIFYNLRTSVISAGGLPVIALTSTSLLMF
jgi:hypothetical protein